MSDLSENPSIDTIALNDCSTVQHLVTLAVGRCPKSTLCSVESIDNAFHRITTVRPNNKEQILCLSSRSYFWKNLVQKSVVVVGISNNRQDATFRCDVNRIADSSHFSGPSSHNRVFSCQNTSSNVLAVVVLGGKPPGDHRVSSVKRRQVSCSSYHCSLLTRNSTRSEVVETAVKQEVAVFFNSLFKGLPQQVVDVRALGSSHDRRPDSHERRLKPGYKILELMFFQLALLRNDFETRDLWVDDTSLAKGSDLYGNVSIVIVHNRLPQLSRPLHRSIGYTVSLQPFVCFVDVALGDLPRNDGVKCVSHSVKNDALVILKQRTAARKIRTHFANVRWVHPRMSQLISVCVQKERRIELGHVFLLV